MASTQAGPVRHPKGPPEPEPARGAVPFLWAVLDSTVGSKVLVALTGLGLVGFVVFHMIGNLKIFQGQDAINSYAYFLKHNLGALIWIARAGLLGIFLLHLTLAIRLTVRSRAARPVPYQFPGSVQATVASRTMIWTGVVIGLFTLYHLAHFTLGWTHRVPDPTGALQRPDLNANQLVMWRESLPRNPPDVTYLELRDDKGRHDVYSMVVAGFRNPLISGLYVIAQIALFVHLLHGVQSAFQTLGLKNRRFAHGIWWLGFLTAFTVLVGNLVIVFGVILEWAPPVGTTAS